MKASGSRTRRTGLVAFNTRMEAHLPATSRMASSMGQVSKSLKDKMSLLERGKMARLMDKAL